MSQFFWACIARLLFKWQWLRNRLILSAFNRPHKHQLGDYMGRWWLLPRSRWLPFAIRIHHIRRADMGDHPHNHPGTFRTFVLHGWYIEERRLGEHKYYPRYSGETALMPKDQYHRIVYVAKGGVTTLVIEYGHWGKRWGFWKDGQHVDHEDYHEPR